jgi:hypothetical protein
VLQSSESVEDSDVFVSEDSELIGLSFQEDARAWRLSCFPESEALSLLESVISAVFFFRLFWLGVTAFQNFLNALDMPLEKNNTNQKKLKIIKIKSAFTKYTTPSILIREFKSA